MQLRLPTWLTRVAITVAWHRRLLAAGLAAATAALALESLGPESPDTAAVLVAAHDLSGGTVLEPGDVELAWRPPDAVPAGAFSEATDVVGRVLANPVRHGEMLTDVRLIGQSLLDGWGDDLVATPVRIADRGVVALVRPGDRIDVLAAPAAGVGPAETVARQAAVLAVPDTADSGPMAEGALLVVATSPGVAAALARAAVTSRLSLTLAP